MPYACECRAMDLAEVAQARFPRPLRPLQGNQRLDPGSVVTLPSPFSCGVCETSPRGPPRGGLGEAEGF